MGPADFKNHDPGDNRTDTSMPRPPPLPPAAQNPHVIPMRRK